MSYRGGRLQVLQAISPPEGSSLLAERLVELCMWGILSAPMLQWLADAAVTDGVNKRQLLDLASLGAHG
eukprot:13305236-Alexandrium_andersonii.AAC.1